MSDLHFRNLYFVDFTLTIAIVPGSRSRRVQVSAARRHTRFGVFALRCRRPAAVVTAAVAAVVVMLRVG